VRNERTLAYAAFVVVCIVWGTTYLAIRIAIRSLPTLLFAGARFSIAGVVLLGLAMLRGERLPRRSSDWWNLVLIGILMVGIANVAVVWAEHYVTSGFAALLVATAPFWMAILEALRPDGARITARKAAGLAIGFSGVALLVGPELGGSAFTPMFLAGVVVLQLGSIAWNYGSIRSKYHMSSDVGPLTSAALQMAIGGGLIALIGLVRGESNQFHFTRDTLLAFLYLLFFGSILAYAAYVYALSKLPTSTTSLYAYINPLVAVVLGWVILRERIGWNALAGMLVIFAGVALVQTGGRKEGRSRTADNPAELPGVLEGEVARR